MTGAASGRQQNMNYLTADYIIKTLTRPGSAFLTEKKMMGNLGSQD
jgi:hypothetical protein